MKLSPKHIVVKILCFFLLISFVPLMLMNILWYKRSGQLLTENALTNARQMLNQTSLSIDNTMNALTTISLSVLFDNDLLSILSSKPGTPAVQQERRKDILTKLKQAKNINNIISAVTLVNANYRLSSSESEVDYERLLSSEWYTAFTESGSLKAYTAFRLPDYLSHVNLPSFAILRRINNKDGHPLGTLIIELRSEVFTRILEELHGEQLAYALVYNKEGMLIYSSEELPSMELHRAELLQSAGSTTKLTIEGQPFIVSSVRQNQIDWIVYSLTRQDELFAQMHGMQNTMNMALALLMILVVVTALCLSAQLVKPIARLSKATRQIREGDLSVRVPVDARDEIGQLGGDFNDMVEHVQRLVKEVEQNERRSKEAEMRALQAQINPHFLYNTLNSIRWMAAMHGMDTISEMILSLTRLLEFTGKTTADYVTIRSELEHVDHYLHLMELRYNHAFQVKRVIDDTVLDCWTLKFILQPLVENAIFHGIEPKGRGTIWLTVERKEQSVLFGVADDGIGMHLESQEHRTFSGMGLSNVSERLQLHFGNRAKLTIDSEPGKGTRISFAIPLLEKRPVDSEKENLP